VETRHIYPAPWKPESPKLSVGHAMTNIWTGPLTGWSATGAIVGGVIGGLLSLFLKPWQPDFGSLDYARTKIGTVLLAGGGAMVGAIVGLWLETVIRHG
jgi:hypothetical protein